MNCFLRLRLALLFVGVWAACPFCSAWGQAKNDPAEFLVLITLDGLRWQEVFSGADLKLMNKDAGGVRDVKTLRKRFWRESAIERRKSLLPFLWNTIAVQGQLIGDPEKDSSATSTNGLYFSYPGYNELLTGKADPRIASNAKTYNSNTTVLEWLNQQDPFKGRVAAFCSWDVFPFIINDKRSGVYVNAGWSPIQIGPKAKIDALNRLADQMPKVWPHVRYDHFTLEAAIEFMKQKKPKVLYVAFGETDDWAHDGRYDLYLDSAQRTDAYIQKIWNTVQSMPTYKNKTAMLISTDHGRGDGREGWKNHSVVLKGSQQIWYAALGKGVAAKGNRSSQKVTQSQFAATAASLLGLKFELKGVANPIDLNER